MIHKLRKKEKKGVWLKKVKEDRGENAHSSCRLGRPEKLAGMLPVSSLLDKSLHILFTKIMSKFMENIGAIVHRIQNLEDS